MTEGRIIHEYVLSDEQLDALADRLSARVAEDAAKRAIEIMYADVGKNVVRKLIQALGFLALCLLVYLAGNKAITAH